MRCIITILGLSNSTNARYICNDTEILNLLPNLKENNSINTFTLLNLCKGYDIIPLYTKDSKIANLKALSKANINCDNAFDKARQIDDVGDFAEIFNIINEIIKDYNEVIVDVSHGFRHLPMLVLTQLIITNLQNSRKICAILFAKELEQGKSYEIINLKEYLDLANISYLLSTFDDNYTVANHIPIGTKYKELFSALKGFSDNIMALNIKELFSSFASRLIAELDSNLLTNPAIYDYANELKEKISNLQKIYNAKPAYEFYYHLADDLISKNYILLGLILLYEGVQEYIYTTIKLKNPNLISQIEHYYKEKYQRDDSYLIKSFCMNLSKSKGYDRLKKREKSINLSHSEYESLCASYSNIMQIDKINKLYKRLDKLRNNLAHANSGDSIANAKSNIKNHQNSYKQLILKT
ncbi:TM1812 family CRISPR-associated protein [Campylobacter vicugnae]|uniref:TM1812 family CRISPR-associated protein n=1 Tax=Campylobacter vicugnae TaxID=1660076 RepID=UPI000A34D529|nr:MULTISPECIES: TM1812 family CRISPR-associated protein [unclassified Campylobacter]